MAYRIPSRNAAESQGSNNSTAADSLKTLNSRATPKQTMAPRESPQEVIVEEKKPDEVQKNEEVAEAPTRD